jgi:hypothetical protein
MPDTSLITLLAEYGASGFFRPNYGQETSGQAGGQIRVRISRAPLWHLSLSCPSIPAEEAQAIHALIGSMCQSVGSFYAYDLRRQYPKQDPTGSIVGSITVQIKSLGSNGISLALKGLPVGYVLTRGDYVGFTYSSTKKALHQVVAATVTADGSGDTAEFEVHPAIRQGAAVDDAVSVKQPIAEFRIVPGTYDPSADGAMDQLSLEAMQVV